MRKPALVLIHGWGLNEEIWSNIAAPLREHFDVHLLSLPGYGKKQAERSPKTLYELAESLLDQAPKSAIWCGWSLGGMAALAAARAQPDRISALQLLCVTPRFVSEENWDHGTDIFTFTKFAQNLADDYKRGIQRFLLLQAGTSSESKQLARQAGKALHKHPAPSTETLMSGLDILETADLRPDLNRVEIPCQVIAGRRDRVVSPQACAYMAEQLPDATYVQLNSGHAPHLSHAQELIELLREFQYEASV